MSTSLKSKVLEQLYLKAVPGGNVANLVEDKKFDKVQYFKDNSTGTFYYIKSNLLKTENDPDIIEILLR